MSDDKAQVIDLEPFVGEVKTPEGNVVNRRFRARVVRARTAEEALAALPEQERKRVLHRQESEAGVQVGPSTAIEVERHDFKSFNERLIKPPYNQLRLTQLEEISDVLRECFDAMATNIVGFGFAFKERKMSEEFRERNKTEIEKEERALQSLFQYLCIETSFTQCRFRTKRSEENTGNGYWELIRDPEDNKPQQIVHLVSWQMAIGKVDKDFTEHEVKYVDPETLKIRSVLRQKKFRRFAQIDSTGRPIVWLKEFNDPRQINRKTGDVHDPEALDRDQEPVGPLPLRDQANECIHFKIHSDRSPYGIPRWVGRLVAILANRKVEEVNFFSIDTHIPSMLIMVEGGQLTDSSIDRLTEMVESQVSTSPNRSTFVILESESAEGVTLLPGQPGAPKIAVKELHQAQISEELYGQMTDSTQRKVVRSFRLPLLFVGREEGLTKANGVVSRQLANEQVFAPERDSDDWQMTQILLEMEIRFHVFKTNSPNITDNAELIRAMAVGEKSGVISPRRANIIMEDIMEQSLGPLPNTDPDTPFGITFAQAQNAQLPPGQEGGDSTERTEREAQEDWYDEFILRLISDPDEIPLEEDLI